MLIGLCVVRNEGDVLAEVLAHAAPRYDLILAVDVASTDNTRAIIDAAAVRHRHLVALPSLGELRRAEQVWRHLWVRFRPHLPARSWWANVDGDEFCDADLRVRVREAEAEGADHIQAQWAAFVYRQSDAAAWRAGQETLADRARPIAERRLFYTMENYCVRLFRDHAALRWPGDTAVPPGLIRPSRERLVYRHYPHRDLDQLAVRLATRQALERPTEFRNIHYHWDYTPEEALMPDDNPKLQRFTPGEPYVADPSLAKPWAGTWTVRALRQWRRWRASQQALHEDPLYPDIDVPALLRVAGKGVGL